MTHTVELDLDRGEYIVRDSAGTEVYADGWEREARIKASELDDARLPEYPCDICGMNVEPGEKYTVSDGGLTVEHADCVSGWFRSNFGRETLH